jgi:pimeloyl-ACP methyl ester carboxylesterase
MALGHELRPWPSAAIIRGMEYGIAEPRQRGAVGLEDGRALAWAAWGPADGAPVLFFAGAATGRSLGFGADLLDRLNVRLLSVDRPGLGASDPDPARTLSDWSGDVEQLGQALGLVDVRIVGFSQGAPFALACAADGLPTSVAIVSGQDDLRHPAFAGLLDPEVAGLLQAVASDPDGIEANIADSANAEMLWTLIGAYSSEIDLAVYRAPAFEAAFRKALAEGFAQGAAGYARDFVLATGTWPFAVEAIRVPVHLWYGASDTSTVHSPDHGAELARRIPGAHRHLILGAGGALLWTHAEAILSALLSG